jgi:phenylpropionate dioxygenase-like ring-hydroxylating dioxygenase large terminal subunit
MFLLLFLLLPTVSCFSGKMPFWYPIGTEKTLLSGIQPLRVMGVPYVSYPKNNSQLIVHTDVCPHMGASFSQGGWVNEHHHLQCPYHGFEFDQGKFICIPSSKKESPVRINSHKGLFLPPLLKKNGYYYMFPEDLDQIVLSTPYFPPEHDDPNFLAVHGHQLLDCTLDSLVENLLDMLHISYVHSFGNMDMPLARNIHYTDLNEYAGRTSFEYSPNSNTISNKVGKTQVVHVENEFHLPTTTLTRVKAGDIIKTVFTQSLPVDKNKTLLFWTVYRNFWKDPFLPEFNILGDWLLEFLMKRTIQEDASILSRCYPEKRKGFLTKYDITIRKYRDKTSQLYTE